MARSKIIKGIIPDSDLNPNLIPKPSKEAIQEFEKLLNLVAELSEEEKQALLNSK